MALVVALVGCASTQPTTPGPSTPGPTPAPAPQTGPVAGGRIVYGNIGDAESLNPIYSADTSSSFIAYRVHEGLIEIDDKLAVVPSLAEKWDVTNDGKTWTFHLKKGVKWHDGAPFTAKDVAFTYFSIMHPLYAGTRQSGYDKLVGFTEAKAQYTAIKKDQTDKKIDDAAAEAALIKAWEGFKFGGAIKIMDDHTIQFNNAEPFAPFLNNLSMGILPEHLLKDVRPDKMKEHATNSKPVGTGPFTFGSWTKGDNIVLNANKDYHGGEVYLGQIIYKIIPDQNAIAIALETGEIDLGAITPELVDRFKGKTGLKIWEYQALSYTYLGYNLRNPLFQDVKVRQAITHALDRDTMVDVIMMGHGTVANSHGAPVRWDYNPNVPVFNYNVAKAKQLLAEAGWTPGADGILQKDGTPFKFVLMTNQNKVREQVVTIMQQQLKEVGIAAEPRIMEWSSFVSNNLLGQDFEAIVVGWSIGVEPDSYSIWHSSQAGKGSFNFVGYENKRVDELLEKARVNPDTAQRKQMYGELQQQLAQDQPYTFLFFPNDILVMRDKFAGPITATPAGLVYNIHEWYVPKDKQ